jgi:DNA repair/transcription protein MET18/MMS19
MLSIHENDPGFLRRFCEYFEGEKDPRNLMVLFSIMLVISTEWDISTCVREVFDSFFNYFPITFRPPPDDPYKITANDLKERLKACIGATPAFAPYAFSGLLEKLDSFGLNTKVRRSLMAHLYLNLDRETFSKHYRRLHETMDPKPWRCTL